MPIEERVVHYFLAMGAQQIPNTEPHRAGFSFLLGGEKVHALIVKPEDLAQRNAIIDTLLNLSTLRSFYQLVYLAAPRLLGATIDATTFRTRGIGLLFFDERRIDEAVAPQPLLVTPIPAAAPQADGAVVTELATLKSMYLEMERTLNQMRNDITNLHNSPRINEEKPRPPLTEPIHAVTAQAFFTQSAPSAPSGLPSYFTNNPWLDVLSKRGNGEHDRIAG